MDDWTLWALALDEGRLVVSKDEDFFILAMRPSDTAFALAADGKLPDHPLLASLGPAWPGIEEAFHSRQRIVEVR